MRQSGIKIHPGDIISYLDMCTEENTSLQRGMNYRLSGGLSVVLMSIRKGAPYQDRVENNGEVIVYEGHDAPRSKTLQNPKEVDQPLKTDKGTITQNGLFYNAAIAYKKKNQDVEIVKIYEKIKQGIWSFNGLFKLIDAWPEINNNRTVYKFKFEMTGEYESTNTECIDLKQTRVIPTSVKLEVWERDKGRCVQCGSTDNLHFDHIIPYSKGGSSLTADNIQILCARHNIAKKDKIQ